MSMNSKSRIAGGTVNPFTFVMSGATAPQNGSGELVALQATGSNVPLLGIGAEWTNAMMGTPVQTALVPQGFPAATAGQSLRVYGPHEDTVIMVGSGFTVVCDALLTSDASGNAKPINLADTSATQWVGARAIEAGVAGDVIRVEVYCVPYHGS